jgi:hypothetical protein
MVRFKRPAPGAVDKANADDQRHAGERQHHHLQVRKVVATVNRELIITVS